MPAYGQGMNGWCGCRHMRMRAGIARYFHVCRQIAGAACIAKNYY